jgi:hypothetical protein
MFATSISVQKWYEPDSGTGRAGNSSVFLPAGMTIHRLHWQGSGLISEKSGFYGVINMPAPQWTENRLENILIRIISRLMM